MSKKEEGYGLQNLFIFKEKCTLSLWTFLNVQKNSITIKLNKKPL